MFDFSRRRVMLLWQFLFIALSTSWLWAPLLNHEISYRTSLISQYETGGQPYSWLFRFADIIGGALLMLIARYYIQNVSKTAGWLLLVAGLGSFLDPILATNCHVVRGACVENHSLSFVFHAIESVITALAIFGLSIYDVKSRRRLVSASFAFFQIAYLVFSLAQISTHHNYNTLTQVVYQSIGFVWLAWYCRDRLSGTNQLIKSRETTAVRYGAATWGVVNGLLAIILSLYHGGILGKITGLYFASGSEELTEYGIVIGVVMLYLSRHLLRGEERARQIFLAIIGLETIKYSVITPHAGLLAFYFLSFCALFILNDDFDRGTMPATLHVRLREAGILAVVLIAVGSGVLGLLYDTHRRLFMASIDHYLDYTVGPHIFPHIHHRAALVAHIFSVFIITSIAAILWTLFRPVRVQQNLTGDQKMIDALLVKYARSSEDFFKLWPQDKSYYFAKNRTGFVAYKVVGPVIFALADPICAPSRRKALLKEFIGWAKAHRLTVCFVPVYSESSRALYADCGLQTQRMGSSALIATETFIDKTFNDKWWRWQKNRARKAGYTYHVSLPPHNRQFTQQLRGISDEWLKIGGHEERGFALGYFSRGYMDKCTIHYLKNEDDQIVAFANQMPEYPKVATASIDLLRYRPDANNAMPFLLGNAINSVHEQGYKTFDLGFVPFAASEERLLKIAKMLAAGQFSAAGLEQFKNKFDPEWQPTYLAYDGDYADLAVIGLNLERSMRI